MSARTFKPTFSPLPTRVWRDHKLTPLHFRVLGAIASHDRFNANGQACWASNARLAAVAGCHEKSVPRAITSLIQRGYIRDLGGAPGKRRGRSRLLTIVYSEEDAADFRGGRRDDVEPGELPLDAPRESNRRVTHARPDRTLNHAHESNRRVAQKLSAPPAATLESNRQAASKVTAPVNRRELTPEGINPSGVSDEQRELEPPTCNSGSEPSADERRRVGALFADLVTDLQRRERLSAGPRRAAQAARQRAADDVLAARYGRPNLASSDLMRGVDHE